jgi:hypothetical protein
MAKKDAVTQLEEKRQELIRILLEKQTRIEDQLQQLGYKKPPVST